MRNGECRVRSAPQFDFRHRQASCASPCEIMPSAKASHCLRRISQGEPRDPLPLRHSECGSGVRAPSARCETAPKTLVILDCGGKRSATPLWRAHKSSAFVESSVHPKAPSPLPLCRRSPNRHSTPFDLDCGSTNFGATSLVQSTRPSLIFTGCDSTVTVAGARPSRVAVRVMAPGVSVERMATRLMPHSVSR